MGEIEIILYGKKVNVSTWAKSHPGGKTILATFHNRDATEQFEAMHSSDAKKQLFSIFLPKSPQFSPDLSFSASNTFDSQDVDFTSTQTESQFATDFLDFKKEMEKKGLFKANPVKEFLMSFYTFSMYVIGAYFVFFTSYMWTGLFFLELGLHQSGWVAHDYLHHAVLPSVYWNEVVGDFFGIDIAGV